MKQLPTEKRLQILSMLCEGSSMRSISRVADVSFNTVAKLLIDAGNACAAYHGAHVRDVRVKRVQVDEIWSFCYAKAKNVPQEKIGEAGDLWTWTALDADSRLILSYKVCIGTKKNPMIGDPDKKHISTSYVERSNLSMRMGMRRFTRLTNAFSKKIENHCHALALYFMFYSFVRLHKTLRTSPAMAAGVTTRLWEMSDIIKLIDDAAGAPKKRGPYKKRISD